MPVERLLPTPEAHDLIDLTRDVADKVLAPRVVEHERSETFPEGVFPALGAAGCSASPTPKSSVAETSRTRCTCRSSRSSAHAGQRSRSR